MTGCISSLGLRLIIYNDNVLRYPLKEPSSVWLTAVIESCIGHLN